MSAVRTACCKAKACTGRARRNIAIGASLAVVCSMLGGCTATAVTLNEQPVHTPARPLQLDEIPDRNLAHCIEQTADDQGIVSGDRFKSLICSSAGIESLAGLDQLSGLRQLDLRNNALTRLSPLFDLPELEFVNLEGNPRLSCSDLHTLAALRSDKLQVRSPIHCRELPEQH